MSNNALMYGQPPADWFVPVVSPALTPGFVSTFPASGVPDPEWEAVRSVLALPPEAQQRVLAYLKSRIEATR